MELDRTEIVIRKRDTLELMDLSLLVLKRHWLRLIIVATWLGIPLMAINVLLTQWMVSHESMVISEILYDDVSSSDSTFSTGFAWVRYAAHLCCLWMLEFPLASLPITLFLGTQTFYMPNSNRDLLKQLFELWHRELWILGLVRFGLIGLLFQWLIWGQHATSPWEVWFFFIVPVIWLVRSVRPFAPEILGLERCRLRSIQPNQVNFRVRMLQLHQPLYFDLFSRMFLATIIGTMFLMMTVGTCLFIWATMTGSWAWNWLFGLLILPLCLWLVGIFLAVFRFLSYIDCRIRLEGWEIGLRMRAEALRLEQRGHVELGAGGN